MAGWNDASFEGADWAAIAFLSMFRSAVLERQEALMGGSSEDPAVSDITAGKDVQIASFIGEYQGFVVSAGVGFVDPSVEMEGLTIDSRYRFETADLILEAAGLDATKGFTRKRPREVGSLAAVADTQGNAAATGQLAWLVVTPFGLVECVSSGVWVRDGGRAGRPVELFRAPDAVNQTEPFAYEEFPGQIQPGDYLGPWLWEEIRDCLNVLVWTEASPVGVTADAERQYATGQSYTSWDDAVADASASYAVESVTPYGGYGKRHTGNYNYSVGVWQVEMWAHRTKLRASIPFGPGIVRDVDFYASAMKLVVPFNNVFDPEGSGFLEDKWHLVDSVAPAAAGDVTSVYVGDLNEPVPAADPSVPTELFTARGHIGQSLVAVVRWDVAGGFAYQP